MPLDIDEKWEFWVPDPEIAEVMGIDDCRFDPFENQEKGSRRVFGYRCGDPNGSMGRLAPERLVYKEPKKQLERLECLFCHRQFIGKLGRRQFCSGYCFYQSMHLDPIPCKVCGKLFRPLKSGRYTRCREHSRSRQMRRLSPLILCHCGVWFKPENSRRKVCSMKCTIYKGRPKLPKKKCIKCGVEFQPKRSKVLRCGRGCNPGNPKGINRKKKENG